MSDRVFPGWRMVAICFLVMNCALGANFAAYGTLVEAIQHAFATSRALASMGLSMITLMLGLLAPMVGRLMHRVPTRRLMMAGLALNAAGFVALTWAPNIQIFLAIYLGMIGPGFALAGVVPCTAVVANWFAHNRGKALGIINMPLGNAVMPLVSAWLLVHGGLHSALLANAALLAALIPLAAFVVDAPAPASPAAQGHDAPPTAARLSTGAILRSPRFLVACAGVTLLSAAGLVMVSHLIALATGRGVPLDKASWLLSIFGLAGLVGAPLFGAIADRIGGGRAFAVLALFQIVPWLGLIVAGGNLPVLLLLAVLIGLCCNGILTLFGVTMGEWLGQNNLGPGMGLCYLLQIPFMFAAPPLAGAMFDHFGSYTPTILLHTASFLAVGLAFLLYRPTPIAPVTASRPSTV